MWTVLLLHSRICRPTAKTAERQSCNIKTIPPMRRYSQRKTFCGFPPQAAPAPIRRIIMSTLVLFGALLLNTYRILRRRIPEYAVHHLFGATQRFIFARMYLFVLGYHVIPLAGTLLILSLNRLASPLNLLMVFAATMGSAFLVTSIVQQRFVSKFSQGLRRE